MTKQNNKKARLFFYYRDDVSVGDTCSDYITSFTKLKDYPLLRDFHSNGKNIEIVLENHIEIDVEFAQSLKILDSINGCCFNSNAEIGDELIDFLGEEHVFILYHRHWHKKDELHLYFEYIIGDTTIEECKQSLINGEYPEY